MSLPLLLVPEMRPNDWEDIQKGLGYASLAATGGMINPLDEKLLLGGLYKKGIISGATAGAFGLGFYLGGVGFAFHAGVAVSNIEQSRVGVSSSTSVVKSRGARSTASLTGRKASRGNRWRAKHGLALRCRHKSRGKQCRLSLGHRGRHSFR